MNERYIDRGITAQIEDIETELQDLANKIAKHASASIKDSRQIELDL